MITKRLHKSAGCCYLMDDSGQGYLNWEYLSEYIDIPDAKYYWIEISNKQFKEKNGVLFPTLYTGLSFHFAKDGHYSLLGYGMVYGIKKVSEFGLELCFDLYVRIWYK